MSWDERQTAMLKAMGLRVWSAPIAAGTQEEPVAVIAAPAPAEPVRRVAAPAVNPVAALPVALLAQPPDSSERQQAIAGMDWEALRHSAAECRACGLCEGRTNTVFGASNTRAHWLIVGEAPGEHEDLQGEPFAGQAGKLLDNMLRALQLSRAESGSEGDASAPGQRAYVAHALKCRPPRSRNPEPAELAQCEPYLARQIALVQPRVILAMGRLAAQSLLRSSEPIGRLRGRVHRYQGLPLVVSFDPAYLLRNQADKAKAWEDLCLAREAMLKGGGEP